AICTTASEISKPIIAEQILKYKIQYVEFETLSLGSLPPTFQDVLVTKFLLGIMPGMRVYTTEEKELIMEQTLKWAGNANILVAVKAFRLKASVQVIDLLVFAHPRITLKPLVPAFPSFANIYVSLKEKAHVDFGLKLLGVDAMAIPALYRFVQEMIKEQVENMYLWPKTLEIPILDPGKARKKHVGILHDKFVKAMNLKKDLLGASDPYVKMKVTEDKLPSKKTTVKYKNLCPEWGEDFPMSVRNPQSQALEILVYDWEKFGSYEKMGVNVVPLKDLTLDEMKVVTLELLKSMDDDDEDKIPDDPKDSGTVEKAPEGTPGGGLLVITVNQAQDVRRITPRKSNCSPYIS
ncbi:Synaptotagmin-1, partial [Bienertia sinuspersici]